MGWGNLDAGIRFSSCRRHTYVHARTHARWLGWQHVRRLGCSHARTDVGVAVPVLFQASTANTVPKMVPLCSPPCCRYNMHDGGFVFCLPWSKRNSAPLSWMRLRSLIKCHQFTWQSINTLCTHYLGVDNEGIQEMSQKDCQIQYAWSRRTATSVGADFGS